MAQLLASVPVSGGELPPPPPPRRKRKPNAHKHTSDDTPVLRPGLLATVLVQPPLWTRLSPRGLVTLAWAVAVTDNKTPPALNFATHLCRALTEGRVDPEQLDCMNLERLTWSLACIQPPALTERMRSSIALAIDCQQHHFTAAQARDLAWSWNELRLPGEFFMQQAPFPHDDLKSNHGQSMR